MKRPIEIYKQAMIDYKKAKEYIEKNKERYQKIPGGLERLQKNMEQKFEKPLIKAFENLPVEQKDRYSAEFYLRKDPPEEWLNEALRVAAFFNGKIVRIIHPRPEEECQAN
jgi:hypothetical protein